MVLKLLDSSPAGDDHHVICHTDYLSILLYSVLLIDSLAIDATPVDGSGC